MTAGPAAPTDPSDGAATADCADGPSWPTWSRPRPSRPRPSSGRAGSVPAAAVVPSPPQIPEQYDLNDLLTDAARPTSNLITVVVNEDGTASFALPRAEVGQGIMTSTAMLIAEELDLPLSKVNVTLADARPELVWNQLTGGSNTTISTYTPVRVAAAAARLALVQAAAAAAGQRGRRAQHRRRRGQRSSGAA